jgi:hypothetical protein
MVSPMTWQKSDPAAIDLGYVKTVTRRAVRRIDFHFLNFIEKRVKPRSSENTDFRDAQDLTPVSIAL